MLDLGASGTWDTRHACFCTVLFDGTNYRMWYTGNDGSDYRIGYATSVDGIEWEKHPNNPVLDLGESGTWDDSHVGFCTVLFDGTNYRMWYTGHDSSNYRIGYATSSNGIEWEKHPNNPVLDLGESETWDDSDVMAPTVLFDGTEYKMWYNGLYSHQQSRIGYATSIPPSPTLVCKTDKPIYNPWESVQVLADVDNPGSSFDANLLGGIIVVRTPPKKPFILKGEVVTETIDPGANPDIPLYSSPPIITAIAPKVTHGAFSVLYTQEDGILAIDISTWGLEPPEVAQEKFFDSLMRSYIDKYGLENLQNANAEYALASPRYIGMQAPANAPLKTALSSAYPNAANPETWFPFQLSEPSEVKIQIYNASGQLVKTLNLGYREAGYYLNKEKAAFWNGRNERGERVASGIYFYTMCAKPSRASGQTKNFTATKRVVILK